MHDAVSFGVLTLCVGAAGLLAIQYQALARWIRVPAPAIFLIAAMIVARLFPDVHAPDHRTVERIVSIALMVILFDGGMSIGWTRLRRALAPVLWMGVMGTVLTVALGAVFAHSVLGIGWFASVLVATAVAPTDPAVVFSVLGQNEIEGVSGTILEGESGANDPVGIALMAALIAAGALSAHASADIAREFATQMAVGLAVGTIGAWLSLRLIRARGLPSAGLYSIRVLLAVTAVFGVASAAHGSGFLAVFVVGLLIGDLDMPHKAEIHRFHASLASLGEVVAFALLGLTVHLATLGHRDVWLAGLVLGALFAVVARPIACAPLLLAMRAISGRERIFVLFAGLKGAVPLLLGSMLLPIEGGERLYGVVVVVVLLSVIAQGTAVPSVARRLGIRMAPREQPPLIRKTQLAVEPD